MTKHDEMTHEQEGQHCIAQIVEHNHREQRDNARGALRAVSEYADALRAVAALPDRIPEWVKWARRHAVQIDELYDLLNDLVEERGPC